MCDPSETGNAMKRTLHRRGLTILAAAVLPLALAATCQRRSGVKKVPQIRFVKGFKGTDLTPPAREIRPGVAKPLAPAAPSGPPGYPVAYANSSRNSRVPQKLPVVEWQVRWQIPVDSERQPVWVLQQGDRILVRAPQWRLLAPEGRVLAAGPAGGGPILLDADHDLFYRLLPSSFLAAARLSTGQQVFLFQPAFGDIFSRTFLARRGDRLLIGAEERALDPDGLHLPTRSLIESMPLPATIRTTEMGLLQYDTPGDELHVDALRMPVAAADQAVVAVAPGCIVIADWALQVRHVLTAEFEPLSFSLDEAGRIYLLVRSSERFALWLLTQEGERLYALDLPASVPEPSGPPLIAHDHTAYILAGSQVLAVAPDGKLNWLKPASGRVAGGIVAADDQLVLAEGDAITAWNRLGQRRVVHAFPGEQLSSPPVLASNGDLLVASQGSLFCLSRLK